ncbi:MAG TPA: helix-turn-helix domain-containing protein [Solirubrobacteraceae bacterium]|nr:helix-turn-helix domain-containing protein [Solirubrobacteraceae bacterium]
MSAQRARRRVPAAERREELIDAAVHEFAHGGLHGTPVALIARRVGVAQPYVFSLFASKRDLFLAALERSFELVARTFERAAADFREGRAPEGCETALAAMGRAYRELLSSDRDYLMLQHQSYAACGDDEVVRACVRGRYAQLVALAAELSGADGERIDDFFRHGMALNVAAALGVEDLSCASEWLRAASSPQAMRDGDTRVGYDQRARDVDALRTDAVPPRQAAG